jgi:DNA-directed RNA polymerase specialized sigma24 family protein
MSGSSSDSVSQWLARLRAGDRAVAQKLWERYFRRLVGLAAARLRGAPRRAADEEDVALSAFDSFWRGAVKGRFPQLQDRNNLWALLVTITARKAHQLVLHGGRQKRGGNAVLDEAALAGSGSGLHSLEHVIDHAPTPQFSAQVVDEFRRLLAMLPSADLQSVSQWKLEGYTNEEIASRLGCALRTVERKLRVIRSLWDRSGTAG